MSRITRQLHPCRSALLSPVGRPRRRQAPITETDLFKFTWIADPEISPDGDTVAFVQVTVNEKDNRTRSALYTVPSAGAQPPRPMTAGTRDTSPRWSPDGRWLAFVRPNDKEDRRPPQLYLLRSAAAKRGR